jgi:hypothetical protein
MSLLVPPLASRTPDGQLNIHFHFGQYKAWESTKRIVLVLAGTQGGKSSFGPHWLHREIQRLGPGDYLVVAPTYPLKALSEFQRLFERLLQLGKYTGSPTKRFTFSADGCKRTFGHVPEEPVNVFFGHASDPESLEASTAKAAWLDEAGQKKFKMASWEALQRRMAIHQGRILITTTPYDLGWLKQLLFDPWKAAGGEHPEIDVIRFDSTQNPAFPPEEFERARRSLPPWKFDLFYRAIFTRPAGLIYDSFDENRHKVKRFPIPRHWQRYLGLDFGGVNTAGVFYAEDPDTLKLYLYREYKAGGRTAAEHCYHLLKGEPCVPYCVGGAKSEGQWRAEFSAGGIVRGCEVLPGRPLPWPEGVEVVGIPVHEPDQADVEVGINRVYGSFARDEVFVFDDCGGVLEEIMTYSREVDERGEPLPEIADKETFHHLDACRYVLGWLKRTAKRELQIWI